MNQTRDDPKVIASWCMYDWANSSFTTLVVTFIYATYFSQSFAPDADQGTALWSWGIVVSSLLIALLSPVLGAVADRGGTRRRYLVLWSVVCAAASVALTFILPGQRYSVLLALGIFVVANVAFEVGIVFYNSFLPQIVSPEKIGRVSGYGWGLGYLGGLACLAVALLGFIGLGENPGWFGVSTEENFHVRSTNILVAVWFLLFALPAFFLLRDRKATSAGLDLRGALSDLARTFQQIRRYREVVKFLVARLIPVFAFAGIYATGTFGLEPSEVIIFGIVINLTSGVGSALFGWLDDRLGGKTLILLSLVALVFFTVIAVMAPDKTWFWIAGFGIGLFVGPNQSASRSLMARFVPERHQSEFFGFFAFSGKATAFLGPFLLGRLSAAFGQRVGVSTVLLFFLVGGALLLLVNEKRGIAAAREGS